MKLWNVRMPEHLIVRIRAQAKARGMTQAAFVRETLEAAMVQPRASSVDARPVEVTSSTPVRAPRRRPERVELPPEAKAFDVIPPYVPERPDDPWP